MNHTLISMCHSFLGLLLDLISKVVGFLTTNIGVGCRTHKDWVCKQHKVGGQVDGEVCMIYTGRICGSTPLPHPMTRNCFLVLLKKEEEGEKREEGREGGKEGGGGGSRGMEEGGREGGRQKE